MQNNNNKNNNGKWFALAALLLVVAAALLNQTYNFYLSLMAQDFWNVLVTCWPVYVIGSMVGAVFGALISSISGGDRKGITAGAWLFPAGILVCHIGFVIWGVLTLHTS